MIPQIRSGLVNTPQGQDPMAAQRAAARTQQDIGQAAGELQQLGEKVDADLDRGADLFAKVERGRRKRELSAALDQASQQANEAGTGYADLAASALERINAESRARAGNDERRTKRIDDDLLLEGESYKTAFDAEERQRKLDYALDQHVQSNDDARQRVSRETYVGPSPVADAVNPAAASHSVIRHFEGFRTGTYWDVNAHRTGYGSDTITRADGSVIKVEKGMKVTRADAERDLARRSRIFANGVAEKVGGRAWGAMNPAQQAALTSIAYNYGSLPDRVSSVIRSGGDVGAAIRRLKSDNKGVNSGRREKEAQIFETGSVSGVGDIRAARDQFGVPLYDGPRVDLRKNQPFQDELKRQFDEIDAMPITQLEKAQMKRQAESDLTKAALGSVVQSNPAAALDLLRSGDLDGALDFDTTNKLEVGLMNQQKKLLEQQIVAQAKAQEAAFKDSANLAGDDLLAWYRNGGQGDQPQIGQDQFSVLSREKRRALEAAPQIAAAEALAATTPIDQLDTVGAALRPSGEGSAAETAAYEAYQEGADKRFIDASQGATLSERQQMISALPDGKRKEGLISQQRDFLARLSKDQVGLMADAGINLPGLDGQDLAGSIAQRFGFVSDFAKKNGVAPVVLTPAERVVFTEQFAQMAIADKMQFLTQMAQDPEAANHLYAEIGEEAPFLSHVGGMSISGASIGGISVAMKGYQAEKDGLKFDGLTRQEKSDQIGEPMREALRGIPAAMTAADTFASNYARGKALDNAGVVNPDDYAEGFEQALGEVYKFNRPGLDVPLVGQTQKTKPLLLPANVTGAEMSAFLTGLTDESLREMNGGDLPKGLDGADLSAEYVLGHADFLTIGAGQYALEFSDGTAIGADGMPFVLRYQAGR